MLRHTRYKPPDHTRVLLCVTPADYGQLLLNYFVHTLGGIEIISIEALYCVKQIETYTSFHRRMIHMACALP